MVCLSYVPGALHVVNVNWNADDRKWNVNCNPFNPDNVWNAGNQVFSNSLSFLPCFGRGVLFFYLS